MIAVFANCKCEIFHLYVNVEFNCSSKCAVKCLMVRKLKTVNIFNIMLFKLYS